MMTTTSTLEEHSMLVWLQKRQPPPLQTTPKPAMPPMQPMQPKPPMPMHHPTPTPMPMPQSHFSVSSSASSSGAYSFSTDSSAFIDDPLSPLQSPRSQPPSPLHPWPSASDDSSRLSHSTTDSSRSTHSEPAPSSSSSSSSSSRAPQVHLYTLRCLEGVEPAPSWFRRDPAQRISLLEHVFGPWRASRMDLSREAESRLSFRDRLLSPDEQRVARPREITQARFQKGWMPVMRRLWAQRLAAERREKLRQRRTQQQTQQTQKCVPQRPPRPTRDVSPGDWTPPQVQLRHQLSQGREKPRNCCGPRTNAGCEFCSRDGVKRAVMENLI